jgi:hypothetical protein
VARGDGRVELRDLDHAAADALGVKAGTPIVPAEIVHQRVIVNSNQQWPSFNVMRVSPAAGTHPTVVLVRFRDLEGGRGHALTVS